VCHRNQQGVGRLFHLHSDETPTQRVRDETRVHSARGIRDPEEGRQWLRARGVA